MAGRRNGPRTVAIAASACLLASCLSTPSTAGLTDGNVVLARQGSFEAGGTALGNPASSSLSCDHGHVEYQIPANARATKLFLWHSSSAAVWQRNWAGGEGFQTKLLRQGYPTYIWDGPRVGRANWGCEAYTYEPAAGRDQGNFGAWRLGPSFGTFYEGIQFPTDDPGALEQANRARYLEFDTIANAQLETDAAAVAIDEIGPSVLLTNSAGGFRALLTRLKSDNVAGIVAYENPGYIFPESMAGDRRVGPFGPVYVSDEEFARLTQIPIQIVWGDYIDSSESWTDFYELSQEFARVVNERGGQVEILKLRDAGLEGNTHIPFADLNNEEISKVLFQWLEAKGF